MYIYTALAVRFVTVRENQKINKEEKQGHDKGPLAISFCVRVFVQFDVINPVGEFQHSEAVKPK